MSKPASMRCEVVPALRAHLVPLESLSTDPANPRQHPERSIEAIKGSLRRFGQQKPIVHDAKGVVIAGNGTLEAARALGWTHIASVPSNLGGVERVAYGIADNQIPTLSSWDKDALNALLAQVGDLAGVAGFTESDLERLRSGSGDAADTPPPPVSDEPVVSRTGDVWTLGQHRLLCGDSTDPTDVERLMAGELAALCATDPPYLVDYTGVRANNQGKDWSQVYREIDVKDPAAFFRAVFENILAATAPHSAIYCWHAGKRFSLIQGLWRELGILDHQQIVWVKPAPVFGSVFWHFRHEPCLMGWREGCKPVHDGGHDHDSVWEIPDGRSLEKLSRAELLRLIQDACDVWKMGWEGGASRPTANEHPTQKPVEIFARPMRKHTVPGDIVFEPFSGSGTQIIAAEQLGRKCRAIEQAPEFVDVAVRRWQKATKRHAVLDGDGRTYAAVAKARAKDRAKAPAGSAA